MVLGANLENFTIDQLAGSLALVLGSIGGLLMIIWKSRCACRINFCYLFRCERLPPKEEGDSDDEEKKKIKTPTVTIPSLPIETPSNLPEELQTPTG